MTRSRVWDYFNQAAERATRGSKRTYRLAALGVRDDGTSVYCVNGSVGEPHPHSHAEKRLCRKLDKGASVYVCRVGATGEFRMARPCPNCLYSMKSKSVKRIFYTINADEYGTIDL